jgi:hypothetical protein
MLRPAWTIQSRALTTTGLWPHARKAGPKPGRYRFLKVRLEGARATKAMARYLACLVYRMMTKGQTWVDRGNGYFETKRREREIKTPDRRAAALGATVVFQA